MTVPTLTDEQCVMAERTANEQWLSSGKDRNPPFWQWFLIRAGYAAGVAAAEARIAELERALVAAPVDPMDWPLPCDVTVGHGTIRKGCSLRTLVARMHVLYGMAVSRQHDNDPSAIFTAIDAARAATKGEA